MRIFRFLDRFRKGAETIAKRRLGRKVHVMTLSARSLCGVRTHMRSGGKHPRVASPLSAAVNCSRCRVILQKETSG